MDCAFDFIIYLFLARYVGVISLVAYSELYSWPHAALMSDPN